MPKQKEDAFREPPNYKERTFVSIETNCSVRGIPPEEVESVHAFLKEKYGVSPKDANDSQLKRINRNLGPDLTEYLGGVKRR